MGLRGLRGRPGKEGKDGADLFVRELLTGDHLENILNSTMAATIQAIQKGAGMSCVCIHYVLMGLYALLLKSCISMKFNLNCGRWSQRRSGSERSGWDAG